MNNGKKFIVLSIFIAVLHLGCATVPPIESKENAKTDINTQDIKNTEIMVSHNKIQKLVDDCQQRKDEEARESQSATIKEMRESLEANNAWIRVLRADVRQSYSISSEIKDNLWRGSEVYIQDEKGDWINVLYDPPAPSKFYDYIENIPSAYKDGWVYKDALSKTFEGIATKTEKSRWNYVNKNSDMSEKFKNAIIEGKVSPGMSAEMVHASWNKPKSINRTVDSQGIHERWAYGNGVYLYFDNDKLTNWEK